MTEFKKINDYKNEFDLECCVKNCTKKPVKQLIYPYVNARLLLCNTHFKELYEASRVCETCKKTLNVYNNFNFMTMQCNKCYQREKNRKEAEYQKLPDTIQYEADHAVDASQ